MADTRTRHTIETEIQAARWEFLAADETGDYTTADAAYQRMDELLEEHVSLPLQRTPHD